MFCEVRTIGPEEAARLLENNAINRTFRRGNLAFFEGQLERGEMQLTHQGIAISESGQLLDGQHRLTAIVNTGISVPMLVASGLPDEVFKVLDSGASRSASDVLSIEKVPYAHVVASAVRLILLYEQAPNVGWSGPISSKIGTTTAIDAARRADPDNWSWAAKLGASRSYASLIVPSAMAALGYLAVTQAGYTREYMEEFADKLRYGENLQPGSPILVYRNKVYGVVGVTRRAQGRLADYIKLFNYYATGQALKCFKAQPAPPMPKLVAAAEVGVGQ
jgi:hypothetical protein